MKTSMRMPSRDLLTEKEGGTDFGTYHHSTLEDSEKARKRVKILFTKAFGDLPFSRDEKLKILDVGCGLGFLSCVCAEFYPNASITGFDTFEHASLKDSSLEKARTNAKILGFSGRILFQKGDFFRSDYRKKKFDILVSNLVFHNFGRRRFDAYQRLARWATPKSCVVLGDLFFDYESDIKGLSDVFGGVERILGSGMGSMYKVLVLSGPKLSLGRVTRRPSQ